MSNLRQPTITTVARKFVIGLSGLGIVGFVVVHLLGNLSLYQSGGTSFNAYAAQLENFGGVLTVAELGLLGIFLVHIYSALMAKKNNASARPIKYKKWQSKGGDIPSNFSSRNMVISGVVLLVFLILHVWQFRFGPGIEKGYVVTEKGQELRDLYRLVVEVLKNPFMALFYVVAMIFLGLHLRHGIWSAFQSMGLTSPHTTKRLRIAGAFIGAILAVGFLLIPVWIYFGV